MMFVSEILLNWLTKAYGKHLYSSEIIRGTGAIVVICSHFSMVSIFASTCPNWSRYGAIDNPDRLGTNMISLKHLEDFQGRLFDCLSISHLQLYF
eukprot:UN25201